MKRHVRWRVWLLLWLRDQLPTLTTALLGVIAGYLVAIEGFRPAVVLPLLLLLAGVGSAGLLQTYISHKLGRRNPKDGKEAEQFLADVRWRVVLVLCVAASAAVALALVFGGPDHATPDGGWGVGPEF